MTGRLPLLRKAVFGALGLLLFAAAGTSFYRSRYLEEPVVLGPGVTAVTRLGNYFTGIKDTVNDCNLYVLEGKAPGGTILLLGGSHPEEPAGRLAPWLIVENAVMQQGRLIVALSANRSGTTVTRPSGAYPPDYTIATDWGARTFRMGDRWSNPLDQWPDPEVYIHYPSGQYLAYVDIRNLNRAWPGRPDGTLTERTTHAFMQLIKREKVDIVVDFHEAELQYPVISTIVSHQAGQELATMVSMMLTDMEGFKIGMEFSPRNLHGLSHREIGDFAPPTISLLFETPEPFLDATRGVTTREQLLSGRDEVVMMAGRHGLLFEKIDERGWPIAVRVGRHTSSVRQVMETWTESRADRPVVGTGIPRYSELVRNGVGHYLRDPRTASKGRLYVE
jgi:hypothetical protein